MIMIQHDEASDLFDHFVFYAHRRAVDNPRQIAQTPVDVFQVDLFPSPDRHVFLSAGDKDKPLLVDVTQVSGFEPAFMNARIAGSRAFKIASLDHAVALDD